MAGPDELPERYKAPVGSTPDPEAGGVGGATTKDASGRPCAARTPGLARQMFAGRDAATEPETRCCIVCRTPLPLMARADKRHCSPRCRQHFSRSGMAQRRAV